MGGPLRTATEHAVEVQYHGLLGVRPAGLDAPGQRIQELRAVHSKIDFKKRYKSLFAPKGVPQIVYAPRFQFLTISGKGAPEGEAFQNAVNALYSTAYSLKFLLKKAGRIDFVVPPLEALWWSSEPRAFQQNRRDDWEWTLMIMQPEEVTETDCSGAIESLVKRGKGTPSHDLVSLESLHEGRCVQVLHVGPYGSQGPRIEALHEFAASQGLATDGKHHEIYLSDPRRTAPERLKTVLRQPIAESAP